MDVRGDDANLLTTHRDDQLRLWDLSNGSQLWHHSFATSPWACAYAPDNNRFAGGDQDGNLKVWIERTWVET